jgi:hypothetical protein
MDPVMAGPPPAIRHGAEVVAWETWDHCMGAVNGMIWNTPGQPTPFHAVKFYEPAESMGTIIAEYVAQGLIQHQPALVIAVPEERQRTLMELRHRNVDVDLARASGTLRMIDASAFLGLFLVAGLPEPGRFASAATDAIERLLQGRTKVTVRIYGGMANELNVRGSIAAAIPLEVLWNRLALTHPFSLLCSYPTDHLSTNTLDRVRIVGLHSHVIASRGAANALAGTACPVCGTQIRRTQATLPSDVIFRCQFCSSELFHQRDGSGLSIALGPIR